jgi:tetratricopeptide (TPR) repeat protein
MYKDIQRSLLLSLILACQSLPAIAQISQTWDVQAHSRAEAINSAGITMLNKRQYSAAIDQFRRATAADPTDPLPFQSLGLALAIQGKYAEALDSLQKSYSLRPSTETLLSTGIVYYLQHDYDAALNAWNKILEANPKLTQVYGDIGMALMRKGDLPNSEQFFQKLVQAHPNSHLGYHGLAIVRYLRGNLTGARDAAERAQIIQPYPPVLLLLAKIDLLQGDRSRGQRRAQQYLSAYRRRWTHRTMTDLGYPMQHDFHWDPYLADNYDNGYLAMARLENNPGRRRSLARQGKAESVIAAIRQELTRAEGDLWLTHELGLANLAFGDFSSAAEEFGDVVNRAGNWNIDRLNLGRALALDGKADQGSECIRAFQERQPKQEISSAFTQVARVDPALQHEPSVKSRLPRIERAGPKPIPSTEF